MKLNKSFIVKRGAKGPREMLKNLTQLSAYIKHSLDEQHSVWIAQREGRAKDGNDQTDPTILKMFYMQGKKQGLSFSEYLHSLNIVPVCISYEYDPCDTDKINELWQKKTLGNYHKTEFEDIDAIIKGIVGYKGKVHVAFTSPLQALPDDPDEAAAAIDQQLWQHYRCYPINALAAGIAKPEATEKAIEQWQQRLQSVPPGAQELMTKLYATPVVKKQP